MINDISFISYHMCYIREGQSGLNAHSRDKHRYRACYPASNLECNQTVVKALGMRTGNKAEKSGLF